MSRRGTVCGTAKSARRGPCGTNRESYRSICPDHLQSRLGTLPLADCDRRRVELVTCEEGKIADSIETRACIWSIDARVEGSSRVRSGGRVTVAVSVRVHRVATHRALLPRVIARAEKGFWSGGKWTLEALGTPGSVRGILLQRAVRAIQSRNVVALLTDLSCRANPR